MAKTKKTSRRLWPRPVLILDASVFNLPMLQELLGLEAESAKKWAKRRKIPAIKGHTWVFSGRLLHEAIEKRLREGNEKLFDN